MKKKWGIAALYCLCVITALGVVATRHAIQTQFISLQKLYLERDDLNIDWGRLQIEQSTWAAHGRVQRQAVEKLNMRLPKAEEQIFVRDKEETVGA